ncbi:MAG: tetratricopeptide repeat protein [Sumerlaeia bacterium]
MLRRFSPAVLALCLTLPFGAALAQAPADPDKAVSDQAVALLKREDLPIESRIAELDKLIRQSPDNALAWAALGELRERTGQDEAALAAFERAVAKNPTLSTPWHWIGVLKKRHRRDLPGARNAFEQALANDPPNRAVELNELAVTLAMMGEMAPALSRWREAIAEDPEWGVLYANAAKAALALNQEDTARQLVEQGLDADRFEDILVFHWAQHLLREGEDEEAIAVLRKALARQPENLEIRFRLSEALGAGGQDEAAQEELRRIVREAKASGNSAAAQSASFRLFEMNDGRNADRFQKAVNLVLKEPDLSDPKDLRRDTIKAIKYLDEVLEDHPDLWNALFVRGVAHRRIGQYDRSEQDLKAVLALYPNEPNTTINMALLRREQGKPAEAADYARKAAELANRDPAVLMNAAFVMLYAEECEAARAYYDRARMLVPVEVLDGAADPLEPLAEEIAAACKGG